MSKPQIIAVAIVVFGVMVWLSRFPLRFYVRNLTARWHATLMSALAFTLVVGLMVVMLAFLHGMGRLTENSAQPGNVIVLTDGASDELFSNLKVVDVGEIERQPSVLRSSDGKLLSSREVYLVVNQPILDSSGHEITRRFIQLRGIEDPVVAGDVHGLTLYPGGRWFSDSGVQSLPESDKGQESLPAIEAVLGEGIAEDLGSSYGKSRLECGDFFDLAGRKWLVVGVTRSAGSTFGSEVWAKRGIVAPMFGKADAYTSVVLRTAGAGDAATLASQLCENYKKASIAAQPETKYFSDMSETNQQLRAGIFAVVILMAIGGSFGVMNTMFASVSQHSRTSACFESWDLSLIIFSYPFCSNRWSWQ